VDALDVLRAPTGVHFDAARAQPVFDVGDRAPVIVGGALVDERGHRIADRNERDERHRRERKSAQLLDATTGVRGR
jgi:hypothetical protein